VDLLLNNGNIVQIYAGSRSSVYDVLWMAGKLFTSYIMLG